MIEILEQTIPNQNCLNKRLILELLEILNKTKLNYSFPSKHT